VDGELNAAFAFHLFAEELVLRHRLREVDQEERRIRVQDGFFQKIHEALVRPGFSLFYINHRDSQCLLDLLDKGVVIRERQ